MTNDDEDKDNVVEHSDESVEEFHKRYESDLAYTARLKAQLDLPAGFFLTVQNGYVDLEISGGVFRNMTPAKAVAVVKDLKALVRRHKMESL